jgi:hypothetical protein
MKRKSKYLLVISIVILLSTVLTGCIPGDGANSIDKPAGFFWGIWHGWIAPISLVGSLFNHKLRVYETFNSGWWYDFGFYVAMVGGFGGFSLTRKKCSSNKDKK